MIGVHNRGHRVQAQDLTATILFVTILFRRGLNGNSNGFGETWFERLSIDRTSRTGKRGAGKRALYTMII